MTVLRVFVGLAGAVVVVGSVHAALRAFVLPRAVSVPFVRLVFVLSRRAFHVFLRLRRVEDYVARDRVLVFWAPLTVLLLPAAWLISVWLGGTGMFWAIDDESVRRALTVSGSSLLTLGFAAPSGLGATLVAFAEAGVGIGLLALVITYLPTIHAAFARRELVVAMLDARAGTPPSAVRLLERHHRFSGSERLDKAWPEWERWIVDVGESHSTHAMLVFFRSSNPGHSWITAAGTLLDAANLRMAAIESGGEGNAAAWMFLQAATGVLRRIAGFFQIPTDGDEVSVSREEFDAVLAELEAAGLPVVRERDLAWERFAQRRAAYDSALLGLASLVEAPPAEWSSDRSPPLLMPPIFRPRAASKL